MKTRMKKLLALICVTFCMFAYAETKGSKTFRSLMSEADTVVVSANSVTFTDDSGRTEPLTIAKRPKKVAVLYSSYAALWMECGGTVSVGVGGKTTVEFYNEQVGRDITLDEGFIKVADSGSGSTWNVEAILATAPDVIICATAMKGYSTISSPAAQVGIPVIAISYNGVKDYLKWSKVFSALNEREDLFESVAVHVAKNIAEIIDKIPDDRKVKVLSLVPTKALSAATPHSNIGDMLTDLKAVNVVGTIDPHLKNAIIEINIEQIYKLNPELIFFEVLRNEKYVKKYLEDGLDTNPVWNEVQAVKDNKIYLLPKYLFSYRPNRKYLDAYKMMAEWLYPDIKF